MNYPSEKLKTVEETKAEPARVKQSNRCRICSDLFTYDLPRGMLHSFFPIRDRCDECTAAIEVKLIESEELI